MKYEPIVNGVGPIPCNYIIIGEAPGRSEIKTGVPFTGRSGELLDDALVNANITRKEVYITNIFKGDVGEGNRNPTRDEIEDHLALLKKEIADVQPKSILTLGAIATKEFYPNMSRISDLLGEKYLIGKVNNKGVVLYPCYHPAYILRGQSIEKIKLFYKIINEFINFL